ncbi:MAG: aminodeoxychorismate lyase [Dehalococcoidia bacterium]|nr:aminodeoxychorismate lyase [Dehalococcoidia bacterium]
MKRHRAVLIISSLVVSITVCLWLVGSIYPRDPVVEALVWLGSSTAGDGVEISVTVEPGDGVSVIARRLEDAGFVNNASMFTLLVVRQGHQKELKAGKYRLRQGMSLLELVEELRQGQGPDLVRVTIPEGLRAEEIADILARVGIKGRDEFVRLAKATDPSLSVPNGPPNGSSLEGYLFPDTYLVPPDISPREFIQLMLSNFDSRTSTVIGNPNSAFLRDIVTLASIVEREAKVTEERPIIAGVLLNRLAADMCPRKRESIRLLEGEAH